MKTATDYKKQFLEWVSSWDRWLDYQDNDDVPKELLDDELETFSDLAEHPTAKLKNWMEEYLSNYMQNGMPREDTPLKKKLFYSGMSLIRLDRQTEGNILADFWNAVTEFEDEMLRKNKKYRQEVYKAKIKNQKQTIFELKRELEAAQENLEYYQSLLANE